MEKKPMYTEQVVVTVEMARQLLAKNIVNRPMRGALVRYFSECLRLGIARTTHQGIAVDSNDNLQDGQHRCQAVVETGIPWLLNVTYNAPPENFNAIDVGGKRTVGDLLDIRGYKNARHTAAVAKLAKCWELGRASFSGNFRDDQLADLLLRYPGLGETDASVRAPELGLPSSMLGFVAFITGDEAFIDDLLADPPDSERPGGMFAAIVRDRHHGKKRHDRRFEFAVMTLARNDHHAGVVPLRRYGHRSAQAFPTAEWPCPIPFGGHVDEDDE